ncbi:unnamed protein product [Caenorhabditis sp. 36 PRJEB53466]|nr:unnamed protein product [Caenorhabditis sp. 36 PRJEB53466]
MDCFHHPVLVPLPSPSSVPSTSSGPLLPEDVVNSPSSSSSFRSVSDEKDRPLSPTIFTDGRTPINVSAKHLRDHPLHEPTGTSAVLTFYPTLEEFKDFNRYIRKIEKEGAHLKAGIAKIVAPEGWTPRPSKKDFSDVDEYEINQPARETIEPTEKPGAYFKRNVTCRKKMPVREFRQQANSAQYRNPRPGVEGAELEAFILQISSKENRFTWNMNRLGTILSDYGHKISGVNTVYLYFGMYKTTFPWHAEDMDLYSINFVHFGAPKYWFAISSEHADRFERFMSQTFHAQEEYAPQCKAFLRHKTYIVTPELLRTAKIPYATMIQRPNEFIITFPRGYHMGFNLGYNLAESTNFATDRWVDYGKDALLCDCNRDSVKIDMSHFMAKYRPDEVTTWWSYWYGGGRLAWTPKSKKELAKKRPAGRAVATMTAAKRARLGTSTGTDGSCSDGSGSEPEISAFMRAHPNYEIHNLQIKPDYDELMRRFKRETKLIRSDHRIDFYREKGLNADKQREWPHCSVCQYFQPMHMVAFTWDIPETSRRLAASWCFSKTDTKREDAREEPDRLLTCENCNVTVHSLCCSGDEPSLGATWKCPRCRNRTDVEIRNTSCHFCELRGGALIPCQIGNDSTWAHVICAIFNRRTAFNRPFGPTACFTLPALRQHSITAGMPMLCEEYKSELGDLYENSRWECVVCRRLTEGLAPCVLCIEEQTTAMLPTMTHVTCARRVGFACEIRDFPRCAAVICQRHEHSYLVNKSGQNYTNVKCGDEVFVENEEVRGSFSKGTIVRSEKKVTVVVDFLDSSVSRDNGAEDIQSCECLHCENGDHQYGSRVKVLWDDKKCTMRTSAERA